MKLGSEEITKVYLGNTEVEKIYLGETLVHGGGGLPYDAEVEWLHSNGNCWIDTGLYLANNTIIGEFQQAVYINNNALFGALEAGNYNIYTHLTYYSNRFYYGIGEASQRNMAFPSGFSSDWHEYTIDTRGEFKIDGVTKTNAPHTPHEYIKRTCIVFGRSTNTYAVEANTLAKNTSCRKFQIWDNDTNSLILDLIPVRKGTEGCMYDKVSGVLFHNGGTGSFTYGNDVSS